MFLVSAAINIAFLPKWEISMVGRSSRLHAMEEPHLLLPPRCLAKGCDQGFEDRVPDGWIGADISFVVTLYDSVRRPTKRLPMRVSTFFCPKHATKLGQIEDLRDAVEVTPESGFDVRIDD